MDEEIILTTGDSENPVEVKHIHHYEKEKEMSASGEVTNYFNPTPVAPVAAVAPYGGGFGGGDMGGLLALALLGGLNNRRDGGDVCDASKSALANAGFDGINHNINTSMIGLTNQLNAGFGGQRDLDVMQKLGSIEGDIWKAEGQQQLALAQAQADINNRISDSLITTTQGQAMINKNISDAIAASLASQSAIKETVAAYGVANLNATKDAQYAVTTAVRDDGDKTRGLIVRQYEDSLNRQLAVAEAALAEQRAVTRGRETEINITNTNTATAQQAQAQFQQQQQFQILANLAANVANLANDVQVVRQGQTIFNSGTMAASGTQAAANTKVN